MSSDDRAPWPVVIGRRHDDGGGEQASAGTAAIEVSHLTKHFGGRTAVADVSFSVARGEVFGFLGPNGAGKTTTVRTLGTLIAPTSGTASVAGIPLTPENGVQIRRRISVMPESPGLYLRLSVTENLECFANRNPADPQFFGQRAFNNRLARQECLNRDPIRDGVSDRLRQGDPLGEAECWAFFHG